jgi:hypothetical protein
MITTFAEPAHIEIVDPATGEHVDECSGATAYGVCPRGAEGRPLPCAGRRVIPGEGTGAQGWILTVARDATEACPLAFLPLRDGR